MDRVDREEVVEEAAIVQTIHVISSVLHHVFPLWSMHPMAAVVEVVEGAEGLEVHHLDMTLQQITVYLGK